MKNYLIIIIIALFCACKKKYTCNCTGFSSSATEPSSFDYGYVKLKDAENACKKQTELYKKVYNSANCSLSSR
jgi:hypothetical protein